MPRLRPDRQPDAEFARPCTHRKCQYARNTDDRNRQRHYDVERAGKIIKRCYHSQTRTQHQRQENRDIDSRLYNVRTHLRLESGYRPTLPGGQ